MHLTLSRCKTDISGMVEKLCAGRRQCEIVNPNRGMMVLKPCGDMQNYMDVSYRCIEGMNIIMHALVIDQGSVLFYMMRSLKELSSIAHEKEIYIVFGVIYQREDDLHTQFFISIFTL